MTNLEKLHKIANFRVDKVYDVKFDNGDRKHYEYETIRDLFPEYFAELEYSFAYYERQQEYKAKWLVALEIIKEKGINIYYLKETDNADEYNELIKSHLGMKSLAQEEYDLVKEILK